MTNEQLPSQGGPSMSRYIPEEITLSPSLALQFRDFDNYGEKGRLFLRSGTNEVDFSSLLEGVRFVSGMRFLHDGNNNEIFINIDELKAHPEKILAIFHELGHGESAKEMTKEQRQSLSDGYKKLRLLNMLGSTPEWIAEKLSSEERSMILSEERRAWARGFRMMRSLRENNNIDLTPLIDRLSMLNYAHENLLSYEEVLSLSRPLATKND